MVLTASASMTEIAPYYEPGAPPPTLPILVAQTEIGTTISPSKLLAQEEIGSGPTLKRPSSGLRFAPYPKQALRRTLSHFPARTIKQKLIHSQSAAPANTSRAASPDPDTRSSDESNTDSDSGSQSDANSDDEPLIPKPEGEAGRPGRGGYNLEEALAWDTKEYRKLKKFIKSLVKENLDTAKCFSKQRAADVRKICNAATEKFPVLEGYANCWPVLDFVRLDLKYTSSRARTVVFKEATETQLPAQSIAQARKSSRRK